MLGEQRRLAELEHTRRVLERALLRETSTVWKEWVARVEAGQEQVGGSPYEIARRLARRLMSPNGT
jgi:hypothetical protein